MRIKKNGWRDKQGKLEVIDREINNVNNKTNEVKATISTLKGKASDCYDATDATEETNADITTFIVMAL